MSTQQHRIASGHGAGSTADDVVGVRAGCEDCDIAEPATGGDTSAGETSAGGVRDWATDPEQAARLSALSAELTGGDALGAPA